MGVNVMDFSERIKLAKANIDNDNAKKEIEKQNRMANYRKQLKDLTPRISKLISYANELIANGFYESFLEKGGFCSDGISHKIGFIPKNRWTGDSVEFMGIINGGFCGEHDFHTNGDRAFMTKDGYGHEESSIELKEFNVERFLEEFDDFETRFYEALDANLAKLGV